MMLYMGLLLFCNILFFSHILSFIWWIFGIVEVVGFFYFSNLLTKQWDTLSPKTFTKRLFTTALIIRVIWVIFSYFFFIQMTGKPFEFGAADAEMYHKTAVEGASKLLNGDFNISDFFPAFDISDRGYPIYLSFIYYLTGNSLFIARILKAILSAISCIFIYKLAARSFNESVGRMTAIFCMLMPNLIFYTGLHMKETEMLFLTVWFVERADFLIRSKQFNVINVATPLLLATSLFFFRTVLGVTAFFSVFTALLFTSTRVLGMGKRVVLIVWVLMTVGYFIGGRISTEVELVWINRNNNQKQSMEYRSTGKIGNKLTKYASSAVFAPAIILIPLPTIIETPNQENMKSINGGNYVKNIMAFFVLFAMFLIIKEKKWRDYTLIGSFMFGYLMVIAFSKFAASERFHLPALPFLLTFAAYGISRATNDTKKYFKIYLVLIFIAIVAWSWFKLAGRGDV